MNPEDGFQKSHKVFCGKISCLFMFLLLVTVRPTLPFWTGYNSIMANHDQDASYTVVAYNPVIDVKPSDMATVYTNMKECKEALQLGQKYSVQYMDQQPYVVAMMTKWAMLDISQDHCMCMGLFRT